MQRLGLPWPLRNHRSALPDERAVHKMNEQTATVNGLIEIAVLDDDLDFRNYIEDFLNDEGAYTVRTFAHPEDLFHEGRTALARHRAARHEDGRVPGDKVLEQLLTLWPNLCIIIVTGYPSLEDMRATFKMRVFDYLAKPFSRDSSGRRSETRLRNSVWAGRRRTGYASGWGIGSNSCASSATGR